MLIEIHSPAPVLNTPNFRHAFGGTNGNEIPMDEKGRPLYYEFVALKGTVFQIEEIFPENPADIYRVSCPAYLKKNLYIDSRFTQLAHQFKTPQIPSAEQILEKINKMKGSAYVWGGNWSSGIPEMIDLYPPNAPLDPKSHILWTLRGVDCSGLLYEAANGASPRNTNQLIYYGRPVKDLFELQPLDMIVYPGHVLFVLTRQTTIESTYPHGVIEKPLAERLDQILKTRKIINNWEPNLTPEKYFTVRRFI